MSVKLGCSYCNSMLNIKSLAIMFHRNKTRHCRIMFLLSVLFLTCPKERDRKMNVSSKVLDDHVCVAGAILPEPAALPPPPMNQDSLPCLVGMCCHRPVSAWLIPHTPLRRGTPTSLISFFLALLHPILKPEQVCYCIFLFYFLTFCRFCGVGVRKR